MMQQMSEADAVAISPNPLTISSLTEKLRTLGLLEGQCVLVAAGQKVSVFAV